MRPRYGGYCGIAYRHVFGYLRGAFRPLHPMRRLGPEQHQHGEQHLQR